jgi:hypothetical protein
VDHIFRCGMKEERLFVTSGEKEEIDTIVNDLDVGKEFGSYSIHSFAETLIYFLNSLAEPIFPSSLVEQYSDGMSLTTYCKASLLQLTPAHYNCFIYLVAFLRECLKPANVASNKLTVQNLVLVFAGCIMHAKMDESESNPAAPSASSAAAAVAPASAASSQGKPKAWAILNHYLTSEEFV